LESDPRDGRPAGREHGGTRAGPLRRPGRLMDAQPTSSASGIWPVSVAIGIVVLLVGLIVNLLVIAPLGGAIILLGGFFWVRGNNRTAHRKVAVARPPARQSRADVETFPRSRFLARATLALGGVVALGVAL